MFAVCVWQSEVGETDIPYRYCLGGESEGGWKHGGRRVAEGSGQAVARGDELYKRQRRGTLVRLFVHQRLEFLNVAQFDLSQASL